MSWDTWGLGTKVVVSMKDHMRFGAIGTIEGHNPTHNKFSVVLDDGETLSLDPEGLIAFDDADKEKCHHEVAAEEANKEEQEHAVVEHETAAETLLRLACRDEGVTLHQLCEERGSSAKGPFQRCINANVKKGLVVERGNGVFFTTGSAMRESLRNKQAIPMYVLGQKEYITKEELAQIFEQMARMLR